MKIHFKNFGWLDLIEFTLEQPQLGLHNLNLYANCVLSAMWNVCGGDKKEISHAKIAWMTIKIDSINKFFYIFFECRQELEFCMGKLSWSKYSWHIVEKL